MKKIYYLLVLAAMTFTACQKQPNLLPAGGGYVASMNLTLATTDYQLLPSSNYASKSLGFYSYADANAFIPAILTARDPQLSNGSKASITFNLLTPNIQLPDSVYNDVAYTVTSADYIGSGNTYGDISASAVYKFLTYKYPAPKANQLVVLSYVLYAGGTDTNVTNSFLYVNGAWTKIYQVSPAQYTFAGEGKYDQFSSTDQPHLLSYFNYFLKNDATIADTVQTGDVEYISYSWYASGDFQRVQGLTYNGSNWVINSTQATLPFIKTGGAWTSNGTTYHTLTSADIKIITASTVAPANLLTNLGSYSDFETSWTTSELDAAFILVLQADYPAAKANSNYVIIYNLYSGGADVPTQAAFQYNGTAWTVAK